MHLCLALHSGAARFHWRGRGGHRPERPARGPPLHRLRRTHRWRDIERPGARPFTEIAIHGKFPRPARQSWHATTIILVKKDGHTVIGGDGQVSIGQTIVKGNAKKVRRLAKGEVIGGFAGAPQTPSRCSSGLRAKLEQYPGQLLRACVELAKDWRTDRYLRRLEAMMLVADKQVALVLTGTGDVLEPEATERGSVMGIGSAAIMRSPPPARCCRPISTPRPSRAARWRFASEICVYTNRNVVVESIP